MRTFLQVMLSMLSGILLLAGGSRSAEDASEGIRIGTVKMWSIMLQGKAAGGSVTVGYAHDSDMKLAATVETTPGESIASISKRLVAALQAVKGKGFASVDFRERTNEIVFGNSFQGIMVLLSTDAGIVSYQAVTALTAAGQAEPPQVTLSWKLPAHGYDRILVLKQGQELARLDGAATQYVHDKPRTLRTPVHVARIKYTIVGIKSDLPSAAASVEVDNPIPRPPRFPKE